MSNKAGTNDGFTIAAIGLLAMCVVTFDHEAMGHGGACLALHGHILTLSSSVFRCSVPSPMIDFAGPAANVLCGVVALAVRLLVPLRFVKLRLFLLLITGFSFFWEGEYLIHAMHRRDGDLYFALQGWLGSLTISQRWIGAVVGLGIYLLSINLTARALLDLCAEAKESRRAARIVWFSATIGATLAALAYHGNVSGDLRDAVLEIGAAAVPLLFIPIRNRQRSVSDPECVISRSYPLIVLAIVVYAVFLATLGRGIT